MGVVEKKAEVVQAQATEFSVTFGDNLRVLLLYGSFLYQDLNQPVDGLDKKPDYIAVVSDLEKAIKEISRDWWQMEAVERVLTLDRILSLNRGTPFYFNSKTRCLHQVNDDNRRLPYKIGVIEEEVFFNLPKGKNIYLPSRLSKPVEIVYVDEKLKARLDQHLDATMDYFVGLTLSALPARFSGEEFVRRYLLTTYLAEAFRLFDLVDKKHLDILESQIFDLASQKTVPMRQKLEKKLSEKVAGCCIKEKPNQDFYGSKFLNNCTPNKIRVFFEFLQFNYFSAPVSFYKNRLTTEASGSSGLKYVARKIFNCYKQLLFS